MIESELLFTEVLNCSRTDLYLNKDIILDKYSRSFIASVLKRRGKGEPIQYILGKAEFMGLEFKVTPDVLIPRQETEILVEKVISLGEKLKVKGGRLKGKGNRLKVLDLGTGSGCIAVSLAKLLQNVEITAADISQKAIIIAEYNAIVNNVAEKIKFVNTDLFSGLRIYEPAQYDIIVINPPYVLSEEIDTLQPEIKYEPRIALDGGNDGLDVYRKLIREAPVYLKKGGLLIIEIGFSQKDKIKNIFHSSGKFEIIEVIKDYSGIDRVIVAKNIG